MEDNVNHPKHYQPRFKPRAIECIEFSRLMPFSLGNAFKYIWRAGSKGGKDKAVEDLEKARWYLHDYSTHAHGFYPDIETGNQISQLFEMLIAEDTVRYDMLRKIALFGKTDFSDTLWGNLEKEAVAEARRKK